MQQPSVLITRPDGVIVVPGAVPVSHGWVAALDGLDALLGSRVAPAPRGEARGERHDQPPGMGG